MESWSKEYIVKKKNWTQRKLQTQQDLEEVCQGKVKRATEGNETQKEKNKIQSNSKFLGMK